MIETFQDVLDQISWRSCGEPCCGYPGYAPPRFLWQAISAGVAPAGFRGCGFTEGEDVLGQFEAPCTVENWRIFAKRVYRQTSSSSESDSSPGYSYSASSSAEYESVQEYDQPFSVSSCIYSDSAELTTECTGSGSSQSITSSPDGSSTTDITTVIFIGGQPVPGSPGSFYPACYFRSDSTYTITIPEDGAYTTTATYFGTSPLSLTPSYAEATTTTTRKYYDGYTWPEWYNNVAIPQLNAIIGQAKANEDCWGTNPASFALSDINLISSRRLGSAQALAIDSTITEARFRFRIPNNFEGSKCYITYDVVEFPTDTSIAPSIVEEDNTVEWTGPGTGAFSDESWMTPWVSLAPPTIAATRRIRNVRFSYWSGSRYGIKPQVGGPAFPVV